jgi:hypothetical protein
MSENETKDQNNSRQESTGLKANKGKRKHSPESIAEISNRMYSRSNNSKGINEESQYMKKYISEDALQIINDEEEPKCGNN